MTQSKEQARREFQRMVKWISVAAVVMVIGALAFLQAMDALSVHSVIATILGVLLIPMLYVAVEKVIGGAKQPATSGATPPQKLAPQHGPNR